MPKASRRESDLNSLRSERQANALPWSRTPFAHGLGVSEPDDPLEELKPGELRVKAPEEVPWIGKAPASWIIEQRSHFCVRPSPGNCHDHSICQLNVNTTVSHSRCSVLICICDSDGTPVLQLKDALGYVCYFFFVWWIWVAQVAYNMRFRQADALHRIWARISMT
jgi:hypothetical protein